MARYYFDLRDGDDLVPDDEGLELSCFARVQEEAARSLADMARDTTGTITTAPITTWQSRSGMTTAFRCR